MTPPDAVLPCGCIIRHEIEDDGTKAVNLIPCHQGCDVVGWVLRVAAKRHIPVERKILP